MTRNRRAGVEDRWSKTVRDDQGNTQTVPSTRSGIGKRWRARYVDEHGRDHSQMFARKIDAQRWLDQQVSDQVTGTWTDPRLGSQHLRVIAAKWLETKATKAPKTYAGYRSILNTLVLPRWGDVPLRDINYDNIQQWISGLSVSGSARFKGKGLSPSRVIQTHQVMSQILRYAVRAKCLPSNPADDAELPRLNEVERRYLSHDELHRLAFASGRFRTLVLTLGYCGLRFGEAVALKVSDLDLDARRIRVSRSVTHVATIGMQEGPTKSHATRSVPIPKFLAPMLKADIEGRDGDQLVFPSPRRGGWLPLGEFRWAFDKATAAVKLGEFVPHELRHTCASLAISVGANVKVVQKLLGHKTATMTLDRYGHLFPDDLDAVADRLNEGAAVPLRSIPRLRLIGGDGNLS